MKKYIPTLMEMYQDMIKQNDIHIQQEKKRKWDWKATPARPYFYTYCNPYSETMLHSIITVINKLNNR